MPPVTGDEMFVEIGDRFGPTCKPVSRPSRGSGCRIVFVVSASLSMSWISTSPFLSTKPRVVVSSWLRSRSAFETSLLVLVNLSVKLARSLFSATNCWSLWYSALTNSARLRTTPKKSPRPLFSAVSASARLLSVWLICWPLPASP